MARTHLVPAPLSTLPLDRLKASHVDALVLRLGTEGKAASTVRRADTILGAALDAAVRDQLGAHIVAALVRRPKVETIQARGTPPLPPRHPVATRPSLTIDGGERATNRGHPGLPNPHIGCSSRIAAARC